MKNVLSVSHVVTGEKPPADDKYQDLMVVVKLKQDKFMKLRRVSMRRHRFEPTDYIFCYIWTY